MRITIIVPIYNIEKYIELCIKSLIQLDKRITEIICVNDGSTDQSESIVKQYLNKDSRIKLINKENGGLSSARNSGLSVATGDYIMFVDGDDYIYPDVVHKLLDELEQQENIDAVWTGYVRKDWNGIHTEKTQLRLGFWNAENVRNEFIPSIIGRSFEKLYAWFRGEKPLNQDHEYPTVWHGLYCKQIIDSYGLQFNENVITGEDVLFNWEYFMYVNNLYVTDMNYYCYVWRVGSLSQDTKWKFLRGKELLIRERDELCEKFRIQTGVDYTKEYQASLVMTKIQMALTLSDCTWKEFVKAYKAYVSYVSYEGIKKAYKELILKDAPIKYKIPLGLAKLNLNFILFAGCFMLNKMNIHIYPDE